MESKYTPEQVADITAREKEALECLKRLQLTPACQVVKHNVGNDVFADKLYPYLADTKYTEGKSAGGVVSPYIEKDEPNKPN